MSKKRSRNQKTCKTAMVTRSKAVIILIIIAALTLTGVLMAQHNSLRTLIGPVASPAPAAPQSQPTLSKEYVYAGGRLIATEESGGSTGCSPSISPDTQAFASSGGAGSITVTAATGCNWTAVSNDAWITITAGASGSGNGTVSFSVSSNTTPTNRTGTISAASQTFTIYQAGTGCVTSISPTSKTFTASAATTSISVSAATTCSWTATATAAWITITAGGSGPGNKTLKYSVTANTGGQRTGAILAGGKVHSITQAGSGSSCTYLISPTSQSFTSSAGTGSASVTAGTGCTWTAVSNDTWITITSGASGSGNGTVNYSVAQNTLTTQRTGTMTIAGQTFTVTQAGASGGCSYSILPSSQSFAAGGGTGTVGVTAGTGCAWTATSNATFITITSGSSGSGNGTVGYSVSQNTSTSPRTGTMTIAGLTFTVSQSGTSCSYSILPTSQSFTSSAGTGSASVTAGTGCTWTAVSNDTWITITSGASGSGNGTVNYSVAQNTLTTQRTGTMIIAGQTFTVTQAGASGGPPPCPTVSLLSGSGVAGYVEGSGTAAQWNDPRGGVVARDPVSTYYSLFIADTTNHKIRLIYLEGPNAGLSVKIAGRASAGYMSGNGDASKTGYSSPTGLAAVTDTNGFVTALIIADRDNQMIRKIAPPTVSGGNWVSSDVAGAPGLVGFVNGNSTTARFNSPQGVTIGTDGFIYVADTGNDAIRRVDMSGNTTTTIGAGTLDKPMGITTSTQSGMLYVADQSGESIWQLTTAGVITRIAGSGSPGFADGVGTAALFNKPFHLVWANTAAGEVLYIADRANNRIRRLIIATATVNTHAGDGVASYLNGTCTAARFNSPRGIAVGPNGEVYVMDSSNNRIRKLQ